MATDIRLKTEIAKHTSIYTDHKQGVDFLDFDELTRHTNTRMAVNEAIEDIVNIYNINHLVLPDARGFLFAPVADSLKISFQQARKGGKLPGDVVSMGLVDREYDGKNGDVLEMANIDLTGKRVAIIDDVLATGGTAVTASRLIKQLKGDAVLMVAVFEVDGLPGRDLLKQENVTVETLMTLSDVKSLRKKHRLPVTKTKAPAPK